MPPIPMKLINKVQNKFVRWQYERLNHELTTRDPEGIVKDGEKNLLKAFRRAVKKVPAYREILTKSKVEPQTITTINDFKERVPIIDKEMVFPPNELRDLCVEGNLDDVCSFYSSSGHSGIFSFGVETWKGALDQALSLEFIFDSYFHIFSKKTLLINCLPMGVKIHTRTLAIADTSVRSDVIHALIAKLSKEFDQFILVGESPFIKKVIEEGEEKGTPWKDLVVHVITGGEFIAENYRSYLADLMGIDFKNPIGGMILINMGLSELSISIFREQPETIAIRRLAQGDRAIRYALFGEGIEVCPLIMQYLPQNTYIETIPNSDGIPELVVSMLSRNVKLPLIRYNTGDTVRTLGYREMKDKLSEMGLGKMIPGLKLPFGYIWGKKLAMDLENGQSLSVNQVKEALYHNFNTARKLTGNFKIARNNSDVSLLIQLKEGFKPSSNIRDDLAESLNNYSKVEVEICQVLYRDFPSGIEHNYEKKNTYL